MTQPDDLIELQNTVTDDDVSDIHGGVASPHTNRGYGIGECWWLLAAAPLHVIQQWLVDVGQVEVLNQCN